METARYSLFVGILNASVFWPPLVEVEIQSIGTTTHFGPRNEVSAHRCHELQVRRDLEGREFAQLLKLPNARDRVASQLDKKPG